jgi:hypothetical protein
MDARLLAPTLVVAILAACTPAPTTSPKGGGGGGGGSASGSVIPSGGTLRDDTPRFATGIFPATPSPAVNSGRPGDGSAASATNATGVNGPFLTFEVPTPAPTDYGSLLGNTGLALVPTLAPTSNSVLTPTPAASASPVSASSPTPTPTATASAAVAAPTPAPSPTPTATPTPTAAATGANPTLSSLAATYAAHASFLGSGLRGPNGLAIAADDTLYESDWSANTVTRVTQAGVCTTYATGIGGPAGLAFDASGNLLVAAYNAGHLETIPPGGGSHTPIVSSGLAKPVWPALDSHGNVYLADYANNRIALVTPTGALSTFATIGQVNAVVLDPQDTIYFTTWGGTVGKITPDGQQTTIATGLATACGLDWCADYLAVCTYGGQTLRNGRLLLVNFQGQQAEIANGLDRASSVIFDHRRAVYAADVGDTVLRKYALL